MTPSGDGEPSLFRKSALESMGGRNRLNTLSPLITPRMWIVTAALALLLGAVATWGFFGRIPLVVIGSGVFLRGERFDTVNAPMDGLIRQLRKHDGDQVEAGECIAVIATGPSADAETRQIVASAAGTLISCAVEEWDSVTRGQVLAIVATGSDAPTCIAFVPHADGQRIRDGMAVRASFGARHSFRDAQALGHVTEIDDLVTSHEQMLGRVPNAGVIELIRERFGSVSTLVVSFERHPSRVGGLVWATSVDSPLEPASGVPCEIEIIVDQVRPVSLVLPGLGADGGSLP